AAVLARDVLDHLAPARFAEVDVDVGRADALLVQEAFEDQLVLDRVDVGYAQAPGDQAAGGRAAAGADRDLPLARVADEVPDDQEVAREADAVDDRDLLVEPRLVVRERVAQPTARRERVERLPPLGEAVARHLLEVAVDREARWHVERGQVRDALELELAHLGDL